MRSKPRGPAEFTDPPVVRTDLGVSHGAMGFALGAWALIYIGTAPIAGRFIDRFGLGWSLTLGGVSVAGSLLLRQQGAGGVAAGHRRYCRASVMASRAAVVEV